MLHTGGIATEKKYFHKLPAQEASYMSHCQVSGLETIAGVLPSWDVTLGWPQWIFCYKSCCCLHLDRFCVFTEAGTCSLLIRGKTNPADCATRLTNFWIKLIMRLSHLIVFKVSSFLATLLFCLSNESQLYNNQEKLLWAFDTEKKAILSFAIWGKWLLLYQWHRGTGPSCEKYISLLSVFFKFKKLKEDSMPHSTIRKPNLKAIYFWRAKQEEGKQMKGMKDISVLCRIKNRYSIGPEYADEIIKSSGIT